MKVVLACLLILFGTSSALFRAEVAKPIDGPDGEYCSMCVSFMVGDG